MPEYAAVFTPVEHRVLAYWLGVEPLGEVDRKEPISKLLARLGFYRDGAYSRLEAAVGAIAMNSLHKHIPHSVTSGTGADGSWAALTSRELRAQYPKAVQLFPVHLCTVGPRDTQGDPRGPCSYHAVVLPGYEVTVVVARYERVDVVGHEEVAVGWFYEGAENRVVRIVEADRERCKLLGVKHHDGPGAARRA